MTETTARIRWTEQWPGTVYGHPGTLDSWGFELWLSDGHGDFEAGEWVLTVPFIFGDRLSMNGRYKLSDRDPEKLKAGAERLLEEFVTSLGAAFPAESSDEDDWDDEDGEPLEVKYAAGRRVRYAHPEAGYPGEQEHAAASLVIGEVYTIGWADIGQSRTNLNLYRGKESVGSFNSVFFDLADEEAPANPAPAGEKEQAQ